MKTSFYKLKSNSLRKAAYIAALGIATTLAACSNQSGPTGSNASDQQQAIDTHGALAFNAGEKLALASGDLSKSNESGLSTQQQDPALEAKVAHTKDVQERHTSDLLKKEGVIGTGVWLNGDGSTSLAVFAKHSGVAVPSTIEDQKTHVEVVGEVKAEPG